MLRTPFELFFVFLITTFFVFYLYYRFCFSYWKRKGVPQSDPSFPVGDLGSSAWGKESVYVRLQTLYHKFKDEGHRFGGIYFFNGPIFFPVHPELVKKVLVSDFEHFVDRGMYLNEEKVPLSASIFTQRGDEWKTLRAKFSPTFTSGKIKSMYNIFVQTSKNLVQTLEPLAEQGAVVDMKDFCMRYTTDVIGSASFGVECNSIKDPDTEFTRMLAKIFQNPTWKLYKLLLEEGLQNPGNINKIFMDKKDVEKYFVNLVKDTIDYRDKNNIVRNDFLNILMQMRSTGMTFKEIVAQAFLFFTAGFETSSSVMSYCIHELAHNQDIQDKVRKEIQKKVGKDTSKYTYEDISKLSYLDKCVKETLRKYPTVAMLNRICTKPYQVPDTTVVIETGTPMIISVLGLHRDPEYFPDPMKFDPDRFDQELEPFTYLPFGDGPRNCIGLRFGSMQTKLGLANLLNYFEFLPCSKSPRHLVMDTSSTNLVFSVSEGIHTKIVKI